MDNIYKNSLAVAVCMSLLLAASACNVTNTENNNKNQQIVDENVTPDAPDLSFADIPDYPDGYPTEQNVIDAYKTAADAVGWFALTSKPPLDEEDTFEKDGLLYFRVKSEQVVNLDTLSLYLQTLLDADMADLLMDLNEENLRFVEDDNGKLYCSNFAYEPVGFSDDESYSFEKVSDDEYKLTVAYQLLDDEGNPRADRSQDYTFKKIDGRWVFKDYILFRQN